MKDVAWPWWFVDPLDVLHAYEELALERTAITQYVEVS